MVEIIIAISLMAIAVVPILQAVQTGIKASTVNQGAANAETAIVDAADRINRAPQDCDYSPYAQASVQTKGWAPTSAKVVTQYYDRVSNTWTAGTGGSGCPDSGLTADLVQKVKITITTPQGDVSRTIEVVKSSV